MTSSNFQVISSGSGRILRTPFPSPQRITIWDTDGQWRATVKDRLEELIRLEEGWDGYSAFPVSFDNAMFAFRMLESICRPDTLPPQIVPGPSGDLQIEWHTHQGDIELWVRGPNNVHAWRALNNGQNGEEIELTNNFAVVSEWVRAVTEPTIALATAA